MAGISKNDNFILEKVSYKEILHEINHLDTKKACQYTEVSSKIIKMNSDIFEHFNDAIATSVFPQNLKNANVTPVFKKCVRSNKTNYRPASIDVSINKCQSFLIKYYQVPGFKRGFNSQHCLATVLEKWWEI